MATRWVDTPEAEALLKFLGTPLAPEPGRNGNRYDQDDTVRVLRAELVGQLKFGAYRVREHGADGFGKVQFHVTDVMRNAVVAVMSESDSDLLCGVMGRNLPPEGGFPKDGAGLPTRDYAWWAPLERIHAGPLHVIVFRNQDRTDLTWGPAQAQMAYAGAVIASLPDWAFADFIRFRREVMEEEAANEAG